MNSLEKNFRTERKIGIIVFIILVLLILAIFFIPKNVKKIIISNIGLNDQIEYKTLAVKDSIEWVYTLKDGDAINVRPNDKTTMQGKITIPSELDGYVVKSIGDNAFSECTELTEIIIPDSITNIGYNAFSGCISLTELWIPDEIDSLEENIYITTDKNGNFVKHLYGCNNSIKINISENSKKYIMENGVIFNKEKTKLIYYNSCKEKTSYIIPEGVTEIVFGAFCGCENLTQIDIPDSVTIIGDFAFNGCKGLTNIEIPNHI